MLADVQTRTSYYDNDRLPNELLSVVWYDGRDHIWLDKFIYVPKGSRYGILHSLAIN